jgi:hypothetical protein
MAEEGAPLLIEQHPVGLNNISDSPPGGQVLALHGNDLPKIFNA